MVAREDDALRLVNNPTHVTAAPVELADHRHELHVVGYHLRRDE